MTNVFALLRVAVPVAGCAAAVVGLAISPTLAEQDWIPVIASTNVDGAQFSRQSGAASGWDPLVLKGPKQFAPITTQSISPRVAEQQDRGVIWNQPMLTPQQAVPVPARAEPQRQAAPVPQPQLVPTSQRVAAQEDAASTVPQAAQKSSPAPLPAPLPVTVTGPAVTPSGAGQQYCINIADTAADARFAWQKKTLGEIEQELDRRIALLEQRAKEYREWLARRDEFAKKAQGTLVDIYTKMRPDAAALQLAEMDDETAAAVLTKLKPRNASAILNEMPASHAARLTTTIAGAGKINPDTAADIPSTGGKS
ncbi:MotE family protein [Leptospira interrogans]